jgi:hypothetical protein
VSTRKNTSPAHVEILKVERDEGKKERRASVGV